jgi:hypothetical protein
VDALANGNVPTLVRPFPVPLVKLLLVFIEELVSRRITYAAAHIATIFATKSVLVGRGPAKRTVAVRIPIRQALVAGQAGG